MPRLIAARLCSAMLVCLGMPNAVWRECDVGATAKASDRMLLSGVPIPGCRSPLPLGPTSAFQKSASGCCQPPPAGGPLAADLSNCTRPAGCAQGQPPASSSARAHVSPGMVQDRRGMSAAYSPFRQNGDSRLAAIGRSGFREQIDGLGWPRASLYINTGDPREEARVGRAG
jgi:hypothetical protein